MKLSYVPRLALASVLLSLVCCSAALGCGCMAPPENLTMRDLVKRSVDSANVVFLGTPMILHGDGQTEENDDLVIFEIAEVFKGEQVARVSVHSGVGTTSMSSCGYSFEIGKNYLVFANRFKGYLMVAACSFTAPMDKSEVALRHLRGEQPVPEDLLTPSEIQRRSKGRLRGTIRRSDGVPLGEDTAIYIWNDSDPSYEKRASFERPKKNGSYESDFLSPGTYRITAVERTKYGANRWVGFYSSTPDGSAMGRVEVMPGHDYYGLDVVLHKQKVYSIQGVVRSSDGSSLPFENVEIRAAMAPDEMFPYLNFIKPHANGRFYVPRVPVGKARLKTYVSIYVDSDWETTTTDVEVTGDVEKVEIVLSRKVGSAASGPPSR